MATEVEHEEKQHAQLDCTDSELNEKKRLWISAEIRLNNIDLLQQAFEIRAWFNGYWIDEEITRALQSSNSMHMNAEELLCRFNKKLPFTANCLHNGSEVQHVTPPQLSVHHEKLNIVHVLYDVTATLHEHCEIHEFPFDAQFLNIEFSYRDDQFEVLSAAPPEWQLGSRYWTDKAVFVSMSESMGTEYKLIEPWFDFRKKRTALSSDNTQEFDFPFGLIRLRVIRNPGYYLEYVAIPLWLIVSISACCNAISMEQVADRLGYLVTLLLTVVAFQYAVSGTLPKSAEMTNMDKYLFVAYLTVCLQIVHVTVGAVLVDRYDGDWIHQYDTGFIVTLLLCWFIYSGYIIVWKYRTSHDIDWDLLSDEEMSAWSQERSKLVSDPKRHWGSK